MEDETPVPESSNHVSSLVNTTFNADDGLKRLSEDGLIMDETIEKIDQGVEENLPKEKK